MENLSYDTITLDFRVKPEWGYLDQVTREVVYVKRWQALMCKDMKRLLAEELEPNLYKLQRFDWDDRVDYFDGKIPTVECAMGDAFRFATTPLTTRFMLYWSKQGDSIIDKANNLLQRDPCDEEMRQILYLGIWGDRNIPKRWLNRGEVPEDGLCKIFTGKGAPLQSQFYTYEELADTANEAIQQDRVSKAALRAMVHWMASDEGQNFIHACERNIDMKMKHRKTLSRPEVKATAPNSPQRR